MNLRWFKNEKGEKILQYAESIEPKIIEVDGVKVPLQRFVWLEVPIIESEENEIKEIYQYKDKILVEVYTSPKGHTMESAAIDLSNTADLNKLVETAIYLLGQIYYYTDCEETQSEEAESVKEILGDIFTLVENKFRGE